MNLPKYKFILGIQLGSLPQFVSGTYDDSGNTVSDSSKLRTSFMGLTAGYTYLISSLPSAFVAESYYSAILFEDINHNVIDVVRLSDIVYKSYEIPTTARFYALRLSQFDHDAMHDERLLYFGYEVHPYYKDLSATYERPDEQRFFRKSLNGNLKFVGGESDAIAYTSIEQDFRLAVLKQNGATWDNYQTSKFSKTDCTFDSELHSCEVKADVEDRYSRVLEKEENTYDLVKLKPAMTSVKIAKRPVIQLYARGSSVLTQAIGGDYWETEVEAVDWVSTLISKHFSRTTAYSYIIVEWLDGFDSSWTGRYDWDNNLGYYKHAIYPHHTIRDYTWVGHDTMRAAAFYDNGNVVSRYFEYSGENANTLPVVGFDWINIIDNLSMVGSVNIVGQLTHYTYDVYARLLCDVDEFIGNPTYEIPEDDFSKANTNYKRCIGYPFGYLYATSAYSDEPTEFGLKDSTHYYTNEGLPIEGGLIGLKPFPVCKHDWGEYSAWYNYPDNYILHEAQGRNNYYLRDCFNISDAIAALLKEIDPSITHRGTQTYSQFLYTDDKKVVQDSWRLAITQRSNVLKGNYDQAAQKAPVTLKSILDMLRDCYQCYWFIDDQRRLRIEHISYFLNGGSYNHAPSVQLDFTQLRDVYNKKLSALYQNAIGFDTSKLYARYEFDFSVDSTKWFTAHSIDVKNSYVKKDNVKEISVSDFTTDLDFMLVQPDRFSNDGFALIAYEWDGKENRVPIIQVRINDDPTYQYLAVIQNYHTSWVYLKQLYLHDLSGSNIYSPCSFDGFPSVHAVTKCMQQQIQVPAENDPDEVMLVKTRNGNGVIDSMEVNLSTRSAVIKLVFPPR